MIFKTSKYIIISFAATIFCMIAIFMLSAQPATESNSNSKMLLNKLVDTSVKLSGDNLTEQQKADFVEKVNSIAREFMHSAVYFFLGIFAQITAIGLFREFLLSSIVTFTFCVIYGFSDELHQLFVPGRTFQLIDLCMDSIGTLAAIALVVLIYIIKNFRKTVH
jgi:VanZ family protein